MESFFQDLRFAIRDLRKGILITSLAVLSLALAIGGNTAVFGMVNALIFRPLPYPNADRLVLLGEREATSPRALTTSPANLVDWRERNRSFEDLAGFRPAPMSLGDGERPEPIMAAQVSPGFFEILGAEPLRGRTFTVQEGLEGAESVVMLGHRFYLERFDAGRDPTGERLVLNRVPHTIVGILPDDFEFFNPQVELWVPMSLDQKILSRETRDTIGVGRLLPGVTMEQLRSDMESVHAELASEYPQANRGFIVDAYNLQTEVPDARGRIFFGLLQGAVVFVLLIACVNVANLLLARTQARRREIALRTTLGAGRMRIVRQLLTESILLAGMGGLSGLALGYAGLHIMATTFASVMPSYWLPVMDTRVVVVTIGLTALAGLLFGLSPAWMSYKVNLAEVVKEGGRGSAGTSRRFISRVLVVAEIALSVILLAGGSVLVQTFLAMRHSDPGFDMEPLLTVSVVLPDADSADPAELTERLVERAAAVPGVVTATATSALPQNIFISTASYALDEMPLEPDEPQPRAVFLMTSPEYLDTLGFSVLRGRFFSRSDRDDGLPVAVVSQSIADRHWPGDDALGRRITVHDVSREVVGVVADTRQSLINQGESSQGAVYVPIAQAPTPAPFLLIRAAVEPNALAGSMRNELNAVDGRIAIGQIQTMTEFVDQFFVGANIFNTILTGFGFLALLLAALGTYGVLAYNVAQRAPEFGVRMALGADPSLILLMVTRQGIKLGLLGLVIGTPGVIGLARLFDYLLVNTPPLELRTIMLVFVLLLITTVVASYFPARRAASLDPVIVLRGE